MDADREGHEFVVSAWLERKRCSDPTFRFDGVSVSLRFDFDRWA